MISTNGVNTYGAAAKRNGFCRIGEKVTSWRSLPGQRGELRKPTPAGVGVCSDRRVERRMFPRHAPLLRGGEGTVD